MNTTRNECVATTAVPCFQLTDDGTLVVTVPVEALNVCNECPHLHVRMPVTVAELHQLADALHHFAQLHDAKLKGWIR